MSAMQDMTKGGAAGHLLRYAVPLMLGNWFQLAYNAVDSIIAGRFIGKDALAAEAFRQAQERDDLIAFLESLTGDLPKDAEWPEKK